MNTQQSRPSNDNQDTELVFNDRAQSDDLAEEIAETVDPCETLALNH